MIDPSDSTGNTVYVALTNLGANGLFGNTGVYKTATGGASWINLTSGKIPNGSQFDEMLRKNPEIAVRIIRKYSKRLREANTLLERLVGRPVDDDHHSLDATNIAPPPKAKQHRIVDLATGTAFFLSSGDETTIGRADPVTGILPDVDLTAVDTNRSVSRRHAKILRTGNDYHVLEEVGTVNGTYVNDQRIPTGVPVTIHNGDLVKIGLVAMKAVFE